MRKNKRILLLISGLLMLLFAGWLYHYIRQNNHQHELTLYGNVDIRDVTLSFRVPGRIASMAVEEGTHVSEGAMLASLDKATFQADLEAAQATLQQALANEKNALHVYTRRSNLVKNGAVSKALYDDALAAKEDTQAQVSTAKARLTQATIALSDTDIHAPQSGTILTRVQEPGAVVGMGQPVYTLSLDTPAWITTYIDEPLLGRIYPGQKALVYTDSKPKPYPGHIGFISPQAEFTPKTVETTQLRTDLVYRLRIIIDSADHGLRQGMPVTIRVEPNQATTYDE